MGICGLEEAKKVLMSLPEYQDLVSKEYEAIDTVIAELHAMQNLLDEKNEELDRLQKENKELKEIDLTTVHIKGVCDEKERWRNKIREKIEEYRNKEDITEMCALQDLLKEE